MADRSACRAPAVVVAGTTDGCASFLATGADTSRRRRHRARLDADDQAPLGPAGLRSGLRRLQPPAWASAGSRAAPPTAAAPRCCASSRPSGWRTLTPPLEPERPTGLDWHPLPSPGERFPVADPAMTFAPEPLPADERDAVPGPARRHRPGRGARLSALVRELGGAGACARCARSAEVPRTRAGRRSGAGSSACRCCRPPSLEAAYGTALLARQGHAHG